MRVVVITGCSSGIGLETARAFAEAGDKVIATVRDRSRGTTLQDAAGAIEIAELDVTRPESFPAFVEGIIRDHGRIDILVNNAGVLPIGAFEDIGEAEFRQVMETNFFGPALLTRAALPVMRRQNGGYVIMISSLSGMAAKAGDTVYAASKFALEGLTEGLRQEVARWNIRTALVEPAGFRTNIFAGSAGGGLGACREDSPYRPLIAAQQAELRARLDEGFNPQELGRLIVAISRSDGSRFRWAADPVAERVMTALFAGDDATRTAFLDKVADIDWWMTGAERPPA
ncbi:SDR family oxidoreductase [Allosphingosinicella humi]